MRAISMRCLSAMAPTASPTATANFAGNWGRVGGLYRSDVASLQKALEAKGYDVGGADGLPGFKTRRSIGDWQAKNGRAATCFPDKELVEALR